MGCGASAGGGRGVRGNASGANSTESEPGAPTRNARMKPSEKYKAKKAEEEGVQEEAASKKPNKASHSKQCQWHTKNCTDTDFQLARTINEAYPFDDKDRKNVSKKEQCWNPTDDGMRHDWGNVSVAKLQKKINCATCKAYILDRYEEMPFYFCLRCRRQDEHLEICLECWNGGALATGPREKVGLVGGGGGKGRDSFAGKKIQGDRMTQGALLEDNPYANSKNQARRFSDNGPVTGARNSVNTGRLSAPVSSYAPSSSPIGSPRPGGAAPAPHVRGGCGGGGKPHPTIPSGAWKGKVTEGASGRPVEFKFAFDAGGHVSGTGPDGCTVTGSVTAGSKFKWTETHSWGTNVGTGDLTFGDQTRMKGKFTASDGGGGKIELIAM